MGTIGRRIRRERERLALRPDHLAEAAGLTDTEQIHFEADAATPPTDYFAAIAALGLDIRYVITGVRAYPISPDEFDLLRHYRAASPDVRAAVLSALGAAAVTAGAGQVAISGGDFGQMIAGNAHQQAVRISVGAKKRGLKFAPTRRSCRHRRRRQAQAGRWANTSPAMSSPAR